MKYEPLKMHPCYKQYLWGGHRLKAEFHKADAPDVAAESWELSCHPDGLSLVEGGPWAGRSIAELGALDRAGFWGTACTGAQFPLLVKLIDAAQPLSIQVHPSDESADAAAGESGKAEMWYIVDCAPQSFLYFGFDRAVTPAEFKRRAADGTICEVLNKVPVAPGDVFYILPGTIHAIGAGILIAEIQQSSNTTFRVYDYQRKGPDGRPRPLHLARAAEVVSYAPLLPEECHANSMVSFRDFTMAEMFSCRYFRAYRLDVRSRVRLRCDGTSFQHLLCVEGSGVLRAQGREWPLLRGESFFLPAAMEDYQLEGTCRVLLSRI